MFLASPTLEGIQITIYLLIEVVEYLLDQGMSFVLSERFCQDLVKDYFGNQHCMGRRSDNPDIYHFAYNNNTIQIQRNISHICGNKRARCSKKMAWEGTSDEKVSKWHKTK